MKQKTNAAGLACRVLWLALAAAIPALLSAQDASVEPPVPLSLPEPPLPEGRDGPGPEGWVKVRYSVRPDGTTADVRVVDVAPPQLDTREAVTAVERWTFTPATESGEPIEWHNNVAVIAFDFEEVPLAATPPFAAAYEEARDLLAEQRYSRAKSRSERALREAATNLYEIGLVQMQVAAAEIGLEDVHAAFEAVLRATEPAVEQLPPEELKVALQYRFVIEVELGRVVDALQTYERRMELEPMAADDPMAQQARALAELLEGDTDTTLAVRARIGRDHWVHEPTRRTFAVGDLDGSIREIEVECNRRKAVLPFQPDVEWSVPESWGDCSLFFTGRRGTTFTLYELL